IHRWADGVDLYFLANPEESTRNVEAMFRAGGKKPELWDPVTGEHRDAVAYRQVNGRTVLPLEFAPYGSMFVVFQKPIPTNTAGPAKRNFPVDSDSWEIGGPWTVSFDPRWGGPEEVRFEKLEDWTLRVEEGIRFYSGRAVYRKKFDRPESLNQPGKRVYLDLGEVKNLAEVRLNEEDLGVVWCAPWRVEITEAVKSIDNHLEIGVVNLWSNRLIGDAALPVEKRFTMTNVTEFLKNAPLHESGLLGPVTIRVAE
nr:glycosyl hydrolase [bacterium]